jgi:hypothetical protein
MRPATVITDPAEVHKILRHLLHIGRAPPGTLTAARRPSQPSSSWSSPFSVDRLVLGDYATPAGPESRPVTAHFSLPISALTFCRRHDSIATKLGE